MKKIALILVLALALSFIGCNVGDGDDGNKNGVIGDGTVDITVLKNSSPTSFLIGGKCEVGAKVTVTGGKSTVSTNSDNGDFLIEVFYTDVTTLKLTTQVPGKDPSKEIEIEVAPDEFAEDLFEKYDKIKEQGVGIVVGYNYMTYFSSCLPGFLGEDVLKSDDVTNLTERTQNKLKTLRDEGCEAELIYLVVPNTMMIWEEDVPVSYDKYKGKTLLSQWKEAVTDGGATVIDLTKVMTDHKKDEFKIWHKTDSHWTEYGAYLAYVELMNYIAKEYPDAAPRPASDFEFYNQEVNFGDISHRLELDPSDLKETTAFVNFKFDPPHFNKDFDKGHLGMDLYKKDTIDINHDRVSFAHVTNSNVQDKNLPSAYILRDSFEGALHAFYTDRFSTATFQAMWSLGFFDTNSIVKANPDYIICVVGERNLAGSVVNH